MAKKRLIILVLILCLCFPVFTFAETIVLKSGKTVEGKLIEKTDKYIKIYFQGVSLTYFFDEIESIDGMPLAKKELEIGGLSYSYTEKGLKFSLKGIEDASEGKFKEAEEQLKKALEVNKFDYPTQRALELLEDLNKGIVNEDYVKYIFKAMNYLRNNKDQQAIKELEKAIEIEPNYARAYGELGAIYAMSLNQPQQAISYFKKAVEINPKDFLIYYNLALAYVSLNQTQQAINYYEKVIEINPNFGNAYYNLGMIYGSLGQLQQAATYYEKAIEVNQNSADTYNNLGAVYGALGQNSKAKENFQKAKELWQEEGNYEGVQQAERNLNKLL